MTSAMRLDRPVLVSNLVSGALWLTVPLAMGSVVLALIGMGYVGGASLFLAASYGRDIATRRREAAIWVAPWLVAVALWTVLVAGIVYEHSASHWAMALGAGFIIATPCYLGWQIVALAVRQFMAWRGERRRPHGP